MRSFMFLFLCGSFLNDAVFVRTQFTGQHGAGQQWGSPNQPQGQGHNPGVQAPRQTPSPPRRPGYRPAEPPTQRPRPGAPQGPGQGPAGQGPVPPQRPAPQPPTATNVKYLILGAGAAGLKAMETFISKGETDFLVLEAADTYGGRIRDIEFAGVRVETGADSPRPKSESFESSVMGLGARLRMHKPNWGSLEMISANGVNLTREAMRTHLWPRIKHTVWEGLNLAEELWESHDTDMSVRAAFQSLGWFPKTPLEKAMEWLHFDYQLGDVPEAASLKSHAFDAPELTIQRGPNANPHRVATAQNGFKSVFRETMPFMTNPAMTSKILYNKQVTDVDYGSPTHITVICSDGSRYQAKWAISTFSLGVLQRQVVNFTPGFPGWKTRELNRMVMGAHSKIFIEFPYTFWGDKEFLLRVADQRGHFPLFVDLRKRIPELRARGRHVLMAEVTGEEARRIDAQPKDRTRKEIMYYLRQMFEFNIPDPMAIHVSGWNSNSLSMGSHSLWSPALDTKCFAKMQSRLGRLLFAGEYTSLRLSGHIQGAIESGMREANKAYSCSTGGTCPQWSEGIQCACAGTVPPQLSGTPSRGAEQLNWVLAVALFISIAANKWF